MLTEQELQIVHPTRGLRSLLLRSLRANLGLLSSRPQVRVLAGALEESEAPHGCFAVGGFVDCPIFCRAWRRAEGFRGGCSADEEHVRARPVRRT